MQADVKSTLDILWSIRDDDRFYFDSYGEDLIEHIRYGWVLAKYLLPPSSECGYVCRIFAKNGSGQINKDAVYKKDNFYVDGHLIKKNTVLYWMEIPNNPIDDTKEV